MEEGLISMTDYLLCPLRNSLTDCNPLNNFHIFRLSDLYLNAFKLFANRLWFLRFYSISLLNTLSEKEKLLVTSNFSFSRSVFYHVRELSTLLSNLKPSSANSLNLEESRICRL